MQHRSQSRGPPGGAAGAESRQLLHSQNGQHNSFSAFPTKPSRDLHSDETTWSAKI